MENNIDYDFYESIEMLSLLITFYDSADSKDKIENMILLLLNKIRNGIYNSIFHPFATFSGMTHIAFEINNLSLIIPKLKRFSQSINKLLMENIYTYLSTIDKIKSLKSKDYELMTGLSGPLRYFLTLENKNEFNDIIIKLIDHLMERSNEKNFLNNKISGYHYYPPKWEVEIKKMEGTNGYIDYGVSHGMGGPLVSLSLAYENGINRDGLLETIKNIIYEYEKSSYYVNNMVYWPTSISFEQYIQQEEIEHLPSRMSWCYGSIGILRALYIASVAISDDRMKQFAIKELIKIAEMNNIDYLLSSSMVCHGYSGLVAIMKGMYNDTKNTVFLNKAIEITNLIIYRINYNKNKDIFIHDLKKYSYLEGCSGVLETIYSIIMNKPSVNEQRLLII